MWEGKYRLLTDFEFRIVSYKSSFFFRAEKTRLKSITCSTVRENEVSKMNLGSNGGIEFNFKQTFELSAPFVEIRPAKLTNQSVCTN